MLLVSSLLITLSVATAGEKKSLVLHKNFLSFRAAKKSLFQNVTSLLLTLANRGFEHKERYTVPIFGVKNKLVRAY